MELQNLSLDALRIAPVNARTHDADRDLETLTASIQALGLLQPLLVRPQDDGFEIVAGQRRFLACQRLAQQQPIEPLPCLVLDTTDDATALEASLAENLERLPMSPFDQYEAFARLIQEGRTIEAIAVHFGVTERLIQQRLVLANLIEPIKQAARSERIPIGTLQTLTLATPKQQRAWWKLYKSPDQYAPEGRSLKDWLLGGATIATANALFPLDQYPGQIMADLFGEESYFADADAFWEYQQRAIAARREALLAEGWSRVEVLAIGTYWAAWEYQVTPKEAGGWVLIQPHPSGEVLFHEGYRPVAKGSRRRTRNDAATGTDTVAGDPATERPARSELTQALQSYIALHKQAAVRLHLAQSPTLALRLAVAFLLTGSTNWQVTPDATPPHHDTIAASVVTGGAHRDWQTHRATVHALVGRDADAYTEKPLLCREWGEQSTAEVLARLLTLSDDQVLSLLAAAVAESLPATGGLLEVIGTWLTIDLRQHWTPDATFFALLRDKAALKGMLAEMGRDPPAKATTAELRAALQRRLAGQDGRPITDWLPRYLAFPPGRYTDRPGQSRYVGG